METRRAPMTRADASNPCWKGGGVMSTYETIMVVLTVMNIIMLAENLLINLLEFLDKRNKRHKK